MKLNRKTFSVKNTLGCSLLCFTLLGLSACGEEEKPAPAPAPEPVVAQEPELISLEEALNEEPVAFESNSTESETVHNLASSDFIPNINTTGPYVLQVGTSSYESDANAMVRKIKKLGYDAYTVEVENPADLQGRFIRVRLGYFSSLTDARLFGHNVLLPNNIPFWIDNRNNDYLMGTSQSSSYEEPQTVASEKTPAPVADEWETPAAEPVAEPAVESTPAPVNDGWSEPEPAVEEPMMEEPAPAVETTPEPTPAAQEAVADEWSTPTETNEPKVVAPEPAAEPTNDSWEAQTPAQSNDEAWSNDEGWE